MPKSVENYLGFLLREKGEEVVIKGLQAKAMIIDIKDKMNYYDDKMIRTAVELHIGDLVEYQGREWMIVSEVDKNIKSYKARIRKVNYYIKIVIEEVLCEFVSVIEGISFGIEEGKFMDFESGKIQVTIPADSNSNKINTDMRFIKMGKAWKVIDIDRSRPGLIILHCEKDLFGTYDDRVNEIANINLIAVWEIEVSEENRQVAVDRDFTYNAKVKKNGSEIQGVVLAWESSDHNIAVVNNGIVTGIAVGNVVISAYIQDKSAIRVDIEVEVIESVPDIVSYKMWCSNTDGSEKSYSDYIVPYASSKWFGVEKYINGILADVNDTYSFSLNPNGTNSSNYIFTVVDAYKIKIEAEGFGDTVILTATSNESGEVLEVLIELPSIF